MKKYVLTITTDDELAPLTMDVTVFERYKDWDGIMRDIRTALLDRSFDVKLEIEHTLHEEVK